MKCVYCGQPSGEFDEHPECVEASLAGALTHECPFPGCRIEVENEMFSCRRHWFSLPKDIRHAIWKAYRAHGVGSDELREAHQRAIHFWEPFAVAHLFEEWGT